ncbi:hypothetical protein OG21DRAFT_1488702 [Imleria badia]|nr:hypothetical protein OG21DRAFT_1488702 [Imleria badia]
MEKKMTTPTDLLFRSFANEFGIFLNYTCALCFDYKPNYLYLHKLFRDLFVHEGFQVLINQRKDALHWKTVAYGFRQQPFHF